MTKSQRFIEQLQQARDKMQAVVDVIDVQMDIYPPWKIKQVLAHITGWDDAVIAALKAHAGGEEIAAVAVQGIDVYNAQTVASRQALSYERVVQEWTFAREQLKKVIKEMPTEKLEEEILFPWGGSGKISQIVNIFASHEAEHAQEIMDIISRRVSD
jgi:hypothetical protein